MSKRKQWSEENMKAAVTSREMGSYKASRIFSVPQTTLERYVNNHDKEPYEVVFMKFGRKPSMPPDMDRHLVEYCIDMEQCFFRLTLKDVCRMAFHLAKLNGTDAPFATENESAGRKWLRNYLRRNPMLSLRHPKGILFARAKLFMSEGVEKFSSYMNLC
ncbi:hypothetical protein PR048_031978 [Dryococelus australis]|uniref:HTH psq-type domain-containing protein n=1 Tax=Dryococelus australis TaxID=614101 RepID=A0ABQ9GAS5_9NEOP|nr:hypothetical protein PR048_031978 [Dryococelus australis]